MVPVIAVLVVLGTLGLVNALLNAYAANLGLRLARMQKEAKK